MAIDAANTGRATTTSWSRTQWWLADEAVASVAGTLPGQVLAADVDAVDTGAEAEAGEAAAEDLIVWCETRGLPWLLRASGRPGGRHVLVLALEESLAHEWRLLCGRLAAHHGVSVSARRTLRLLSAPHRLGLDAPVLGGTLRPEDLPCPVSSPEAVTEVPSRPRRRLRRKRSKGGRSRSESEFGDAMACARAGWTADRAWAAANQPGSKAAEMGQRDWRRWMWSKAVTLTAAEHGVSEDEAWTQFERASRVRARELGREAWREQYWQRALDEAATDRPRRTRTGQHPASANSDEDQAAEQGEIEVVRTGLRHAADHQINLTGRRPQFARSLAAALDALAASIVRRGGSISERSWAEAACLSRSTLRTVIQFARERDLLTRTRAYTGGSTDSASWQPGLAASSVIEYVRKSRPTKVYTPPARTWGRADPLRLRREHARERVVFRLKQILSSHTDATGLTYKASQHPAARTLRSLWHQRRWWKSLSPSQQEHRRTQCRTRLGQLHRTERSAWLDWLNRRAVLEQHANRVQHGQNTSVDDEALAQAPRTIHLGMRDPAWRTASSRIRSTRSGPPTREVSENGRNRMSFSPVTTVG